MPSDWPILIAAVVLVIALIALIALIGLARRRRANAEAFEYMAYCVYFARAMLGGTQPRPTWKATEAEVVAATLGVCDARRTAEPDDEASVLKRVKALLNAQRDA